MKSTTLLHALLLASAGAVHAQSTCANRLKQAIDDLDACETARNKLQTDLDTCKKTNRGPMYKAVDCSNFINGKVRARGDEVFKVYCDHAHKGVNQETLTTSSVEECMETCDGTHGCVGGDYYSDAQECHLKSTGTSTAFLTNKTDGRPIAFFIVGYI